MAKTTLYLAERLGELLLARGYKITCAESCTGGGVASAITEVAGSSQWFELGLVAYANRIKASLLGVPEQLLEKEGAVSEATVVAMAQGALRAAGADLSVAVSGVAGPGGGTDQKPVGTVWFCWCLADGHLETACEVFVGNRAAVREAAVLKSLEGALDILEK